MDLGDAKKGGEEKESLHKARIEVDDRNFKQSSGHLL